MVIFLHLLREILHLEQMIMRFQRGGFPQRGRRRCRVTWVSQWLRKRDDRGWYHNLTAVLYDEDHPSFTNLIQMSPDIFTKIES